MLSVIGTSEAIGIGQGNGREVGRREGEKVTKWDGEEGEGMKVGK